MNLNKKMKRITIIYCIFGAVVIPTFSILFALNMDMFENTISQVGNYLDKRRAMIIWGVMISVFFLSYFFYLFKITNTENKKSRKFVILSSIMIILTVVTPFLPEVLPVLSELHNIFAAIFSLFLLMALYFFVINFAKKDDKIHRKSMIAFYVMLGVNIVTFFLTGISSFLEIMFLLTLALFLIILNHWIIKSNKINAEENLKEHEKQKTLEKIDKLNKYLEEFENKIIKEEGKNDNN